MRALRALITSSVFVPFVLLIGYMALTYQQRFHEAEDRATRTVALTHEHASKVFDTFELLGSFSNEMLRGLSDDEIRAREKEFNTRLSGFNEGLPQVQDIWIMDPSGHPLVSANVYPVPRDLNVSDRAYFQAVTAPGSGTYVSELLKGRVQDVRFFQFSRRRQDSEGRFLGVNAVSVQPDYFRDYYKGLLTAGVTSAVLLRADGMVLARYPELPVGAALGQGTGFQANIARNPDSGFYHTRSGFNGNERLVAYRRLADYPVYVAVSIEVSAVRWAWLSSMAGAVLFSILSALGLAVLGRVALSYATRQNESLVLLQQEKRMREQAEAERQHAQDALHQASKMEALARLTSGVAHDFNNLLMIVSGSAEALQRRMGDNPKAVRFTEAIFTACKRGEFLTRQLLAFSLRSTHEPVLCDLGHRQDEITGLLRQSTRGDIAVTLSVEDGLWPVRIDVSAYDLVLINLALNARDAMPDGGRLAVELFNTTLEDLEVVGGRLSGQFVAIAVSDTGTGITPDDLPKVFEPFFTTKADGHGTGLGLSQVFGFVQQCGGGIAISSSVGQGTTVTLYLPRAEGEAASQKAPAVEALPPASGRILLVDDNEGVARATDAMLSEAGYSVTRADGGAAALALLERGEPFDYMLSDIMMPGLSGIELARIVALRYPSLPVVLMTGYSDAHAMGEADDLVVITKPFTRKKALEAFAQASQLQDAPRSEAQKSIAS